MSGSMRSDDAKPSWQDLAVARIASDYEMDRDSKALARTALIALGQVLRDRSLHGPHLIDEPTIVVGGRRFAVPADSPEVPVLVLDQLVNSPTLRSYAQGNRLTAAGIQALLNNTAAVRSIYGDRLPILACMDAD